jgi:hypothetical protein
LAICFFATRLHSSFMRGMSSEVIVRPPSTRVVTQKFKKSRKSRQDFLRFAIERSRRVEIDLPKA